MDDVTELFVQITICEKAHFCFDLLLEVPLQIIESMPLYSRLELSFMVLLPICTCSLNWYTIHTAFHHASSTVYSCDTDVVVADWHTMQYSMTLEFSYGSRVKALFLRRKYSASAVMVTARNTKDLGPFWILLEKRQRGLKCFYEPVRNFLYLFTFWMKLKKYMKPARRRRSVWSPERALG